MNLGRTGGPCRCVQCEDKDNPQVCISCDCEGGDGYSEGPFKCETCTRIEDLTEKGCKPLCENGLAPCPLCGEKSITWIDPKLSTLNPPKDFYSIGCVSVGACGLEMNGWLNRADMIKHWNKRTK